MNAVTFAAEPPSRGHAAASARRVLLVDDDPDVLSAHARILTRAGYEVRTATTAADARVALMRGDTDVVVSDVQLPGDSTGIDLLKQARARDRDLPVVLVTGQATVATAAEAVEHGALRYLLKPVDPRTLLDVVGRAAALRRWAAVQRLATEATMAADLDALGVQLDAAIASISVAWQPIVSWSERRVVAYEALMRAREPALPHPGAILQAAERLGRLPDLGRAMRAAIGRAAATVPEDALIFVNLHPEDLRDPALYADDDPLVRLGARVVLEVTERTSLAAVADVPRRVEALRARGYRVAIDDIGAGYAGLASFAQLSPDVVKIDMSLVRGVDAQPLKRKIVRSVRGLGAELGLRVVAEGVETAAERDALVQLGCDWLQGYLFGRPNETPLPARF